MEYGLRYLGGDEVDLNGYSYSYWEWSPIDRNNTSGCCFILGSTMITWFSRNQISIAFILVEEEYMEVSMASCDSIWLRKLLTGYLIRSSSLR
jgi:hypothetical protein